MHSNASDGEQPQAGEDSILNPDGDQEESESSEPDEEPDGLPLRLIN